MTEETRGTAALDRALARAVLARALRLAFRRPTQRVAEALFTREGREALLEAALVLEDGERGPIFRAVEALGTPAPASLAELDARYERVFGHTLRGRVTPYETEYGGDALFRQGQELADLAGFYLAFGLRPSDGEPERPDHVGVELEFLEILSLKEAYALEREELVMLEVTRDAVGAFLGHHLGRFGAAFGAGLAREDPGGPYGRIGEICAAFLTAECGRAGVPVGPAFLALRSNLDEDVPMACGSGCDPAGCDPEPTGPDAPV